ncbi:phage repressor protein, partial [Klebsiella pneumoniae]|nr:phage repressor protein [Klebsiella pneumoniae]
QFDGEDLDILRIARQKIVDGQLYDSGVLMLDKATFLPGKAVPPKPLCIIESSTTYVIEREFSEVFDGEWLVDIEGKTSVRTLTRIPVKKVRVSGAGAAFDCTIDDISVIGRVVLTIISG